MQTESHVLPDLLPTGLCAAICGTAAGNTSAALAAYYADPSNCFWSVLQQGGLTPRRLAPGEFGSLHEFGLGLTDIAKVHGTDADLPADAFNLGAFEESIRRCRPKLVAFNGKTAARIFYRMPRPTPLPLGPGPPVSDFPQIFVLPSTSGSAKGSWNLAWWQEFSNLVTVERGRSKEESCARGKASTALAVAWLTDHDVLRAIGNDGAVVFHRYSIFSRRG